MSKQQWLVEKMLINVDTKYWITKQNNRNHDCRLFSNLSSFSLQVQTSSRKWSYRVVLSSALRPSTELHSLGLGKSQKRSTAPSFGPTAGPSSTASRSFLGRPSSMFLFIIFGSFERKKWLSWERDSMACIFLQMLFSNVNSVCVCVSDFKVRI